MTGDIAPQARPEAMTVAAVRCRTLLIDFLAAIDGGRALDALDLFTDDADFDARGEHLHGREQIRDFLTARQTEQDHHTAHLVANDVVRHTSPEEIEISAVLFLHERRDGVYRLVTVLDTWQRFQQSENGWRIRARTTRPLHADQSA